MRIEVRGHQERRQPFAGRHGLIGGLRRPLAQQHDAPGDAREFIDQRAHRRDSVLLRHPRQQFLATRDMPRSQRLEIGVQARFIASLGLAHAVEQQVGDFRHGRHDDRHRTVGVLLGGETRRHLDALGRAHAGAAKLHHQQAGIPRIGGPRTSSQ